MNTLLLLVSVDADGVGVVDEDDADEDDDLLESSNAKISSAELPDARICEAVCLVSLPDGIADKIKRVFSSSERVIPNVFKV